MNLACVQCGASVPRKATFCSACGRPTDAGRRQEDAKERNQLDARAEEIEKKLAENLAIPRSVSGLFLHMFLWTSISIFGIWLPFGFVGHFIFGGIGYSPAGVVMCPLQCDKCSGPGRAFAYNFKGSWQTNKGRMGYALLCHNPTYDADKLTTEDVRSTPLNDALQPYLVHGIAAYLVEGAMIGLTVGLLVAILRTASTRRTLETERTVLEAQRHAVLTRRAALDGTEALGKASTFRRL